MAIRFCLKKGDYSFPRIDISKKVFLDIKKTFRDNPTSDYIDLYQDGHYVCSGYNDPNADVVLRHILTLQSSNSFLSYMIEKRILIYSCNELSYEFYNLCIKAGASVRVVGALWSDIGIVSINDSFITPDYELYSEGNPGFEYRDFWHWRNVFPYSQYSFIESLYHQFIEDGLIYNTLIRDYAFICQWLSHRIQHKIPSMIARLGNTESIITIESTKGMISSYWQEWLTRTSGFYSSSPNSDCDYYAQLTIAAIKNCDLHLSHFESSISLLNSFAAPNSVISPWYNLFLEEHNRDWLNNLKGHRVLIISSINHLIRQQLLSQSLLFPECSIQYFDCPETYFQGQRHYDSWFKEYEAIKLGIRELNFDIAIVAAGAYGYPLSSDIKGMGKIAIELCSGIYPLFKIKNKTQAVIPAISRQYDNTWITPQDCDDNSISIEKGAYWY